MGSGSIYQERGRWVAQVSVGPRGFQQKYRRTRATREEAEAVLLSFPARRRTAADRFWEKVQKTRTCWLFTGSRTEAGYGHIRWNGRQMRAHRVSYLLHHGTDPGALLVCHTCDVPACVRPDHLFLGTQLDNVRDAQAKGRRQRVTA